MNAQYARTTTPHLPDNSSSSLTFCSIRHLHFSPVVMPGQNGRHKGSGKQTYEMKIMSSSSVMKSKNIEFIPDNCGLAQDKRTRQKASSVYRVIVIVRPQFADTNSSHVHTG